MNAKSFFRFAALTLLLVAGLMINISCQTGESASNEIPVISAANDFTLEDISGKKHTLSEYKGKVVLLNFFATWCSYCTQEVPKLIKIQNDYKKKDLVILSLDIQESASKVQKYAESKGIKYPVLLDTRGKVAGMYKVRGIPTNALIDRKGNLRFIENMLPETSLIDNLISETESGSKENKAKPSKSTQK